MAESEFKRSMRILFGKNRFPTRQKPKGKCLPTLLMWCATLVALVAALMVL